MSDRRFYVRESSGYPITGSGLNRTGAEITEFLVIDRDYCHSVIRSFMPPLTVNGTSKYTDEVARRSAARKLCAELNAEHGDD